MKKVLISVIIFIVLVTSGCATVYSYNNVKYDTPEKTLSAQASMLKEALEQITPTDTPINASVVVILPSDSLISREYVQVKGTPPKDKTNSLYQIQMNYVISLVKNEMSSFANSLQKRRLFNTVKIVDSDNLKDTDFTEDFAIYAMVEGWVLKKKGTGDATPIHFNTNSPPKERFMEWLINVGKAASDT